MGELGRAARAASALVLTRLEFAALELSQRGAEALRWLLWALVAMIGGMLTLFTLTATIALALWQRIGWYSVPVLCAGYAALTAFIVYRLWRALRRSPALLHETMAELAKDRESFFSAAESAAADRKG